MDIKKYRKIFFSFSLLLDVVFVLSLFFILVYITWVNKYNSELEKSTLLPKLMKERINWKQIYLISFSLIYL
ncbi:hypothetical protein OF364_02990 [Mycoplasma enhydrae]|uniref:hypothetical protein n=1 Tax=Mycoplasma enhydrae TaxID=2499220 RepID=UPI0021E9410E|nr:hypothetical protein [Mycoplasma enhydrae]MCV3753765.1 hypothetical protein [Mycoplasma enhydrae]